MKNSNKIIEINTSSIQNHIIKPVDDVKILADAFKKNDEFIANRVIKRKNSPNFTIKDLKIPKIKKRKKKYNSPKYRRILIKKEPENEALNPVKFTNNYDDFQIAILNKVSDENYKSDELIIDLIQLLEQCPIINKFTYQQFLENRDFDIFKEKSPSKFLFILNIRNVMNIINFLWFYSEGNVQNFSIYLDKLGLYFSYVKRQESSNIIELVLLSKMPLNLYNYISTYANKEFKHTNMNVLATKFSDYSKKSILDFGYCYQDITIINFLNQLDSKNIQFNDEIMYYFSLEGARKIIAHKLIKPPKNYKISSSIKQKEDKSKNIKPIYFKGYNEVDLSLTFLKDVELEKNCNFNYISPGKEDKETISLKKGETYIFEIKNDINDIVSKYEKIKEHKERIIEAYNNIYINNIKKYEIKNSELILICNKNRKEAIDIISLNKQILFSEDSHNDFIFSGSQIGAGVALKFKRDIKSLKNDNSILNEKIKYLEEEQKAQNNKILDLERKMKEEKKIQYSNLLTSLLFTNVYKITEIISLGEDNIKRNIQNSISEKFNGLYQIFSLLSASFREIKNDLLYHHILPFLGKKLETDKDKSDWRKIEEKLKGKIKRNNLVSIYYEGLLELFFGLKHLINKEVIDYDIYSDETPENKNFILLLGQLVLFTEIFEENISIKDSELKYQGVVLYVINSCIDVEYVNNVIKQSNNARELIKKLLSICNSENYAYEFKK